MPLDVVRPTQMVLREDFCEFTWGQPDPDLMPIAEMIRATEAGLKSFGSDALGYGAPEGAVPLLAWIRERVQQKEALSIDLDECLGTAGNSDALDQICTLFTQPGDVALVESPTYHLALRVMRDHNLELHAIPLDHEGVDVKALRAKAIELKRAGKRVRLIYTIPTFHNPTGISLSAERRRALIELAVEEDLLVIEDDVYRELVFEGTAPPSLFSMAPRGTVIRMGSFAKTIAPGLRLGWLNASAEHVDRFANGGLRDSGGSPNFYAGMMVAAFCQSGDFDRQVTKLISTYRSRRDALAAALTEHLPADCRFVVPTGGFFIWVTLPAQVDAEALAKKAEAHRVSFIPGTRFCIDGGGKNSLRLAFSLLKPDMLAEGARRLGAALKDVT